MPERLIVVSGLVLLALLACNASPSPAPTSLSSAVARHPIEDKMRAYKIPALSIAVFDRYELVGVRAFGLAEVETGTRADEHTTFLAGSVSKMVNAVAVLMAVAEGLLVLDAPINDALESWKLPDNELTRQTPVTLRMLLAHTGGTTVSGFRGYATGEPIPTLLQILDGTAPANSAPVRVDVAPGKAFRYSGGGTTITQLALTERTKQPYAAVLDQRVLRPLGMTSSTFDQQLTPKRLAHAAVGYDKDAKPVAGKRHTYPELAAAGLWTRPVDLARLLIELAKARAGKSQSIAQSLALQMTTKVAQVGDTADFVGLGVFLMERSGMPCFGHYGSDAGFQTSAIASLDGGRGVVIMVSSDNGHLIFPEIERAVFAGTFKL